MNLNVAAESIRVEQISRRQLGRSTLETLQQEVRRTIGVVRESHERIADRLTLDAYLTLVETLQVQLDRVLEEFKTLQELQHLESKYAEMKAARKPAA